MTPENAKEFGLINILNPAPACELSSDFFSLVDYFTPNETEAEYMTGIKISNLNDAKDAASILIAKGIKGCIITLGENGALYKSDDNQEIFYEPHKVDKVRASVAAGDAFTGILGASIASGISLDKSIKYAIVGSAISVTRYGAQESMPEFEEIIKVL